MSAPARTMPGVEVVVAFWRTNADELPALASHWIGWREPFCFPCAWLAPVNDGARGDPWHLYGVTPTRSTTILRARLRWTELIASSTAPESTP